MDHYNLTWNVKEEYRATQTELYNKLVKKYSDFIWTMKNNEIQHISLPINEYLEDMLSERVNDNHHTRLHTAEAIAFKDPDEVYCHVQFTSFDGSRIFSKPLVWRIRAWRESYSKYLKDKRESELSRREANLLTENAARLEKRLRVKAMVTSCGDSEIDKIIAQGYKKLAYSLAKEKCVEIAEQLGTEIELWL